MKTQKGCQVEEGYHRWFFVTWFPARSSSPWDHEVAPGLRQICSEQNWSQNKIGVKTWNLYWPPLVNCIKYIIQIHLYNHYISHNYMIIPYCYNFGSQAGIKYFLKTLDPWPCGFVGCPQAPFQASGHPWRWDAQNIPEIRSDRFGMCCFLTFHHNWGYPRLPFEAYWVHRINWFRGHPSYEAVGTPCSKFQSRCPRGPLASGSTSLRQAQWSGATQEVMMCRGVLHNHLIWIGASMNFGGRPLLDTPASKIRWDDPTRQDFDCDMNTVTNVKHQLSTMTNHTFCISLLIFVQPY